MRLERLTIEEVNQFNPSCERPLVVTCDNGKYDFEMRKIKIISPIVNDRLAIIDSNEQMTTITTHHLENYPSQKKPTTKMVKFYHAVMKNKNGFVFSPDGLLTVNLKDSLGGSHYASSGYEIVKLMPICDLEMPIYFEE